VLFISLLAGLLHDVEHESATAQVLCPSMRQLQPCLDDYRCKEIMGRDFGGKTVLVRMVMERD